MRSRLAGLISGVLVIAGAAKAQTSSLYLRSMAETDARRAATTQPVTEAGGVPASAGAWSAGGPGGNIGVRESSFIAVPRPEQRLYRLHDLVNIVVRHQLRYRADGRLEQNRTGQFEAELEEWFRISEHQWRQQVFPSGNPQAKASLTDNRRSTGRSQRQDEFTTRIQAEIIDVKPNGTLVLQARATFEHEDEVQSITLTGTCRSDDISADNSILSDKVANLEVRTQNDGAVRDTTKRGFIPRLFDALKPF